MRQVNYYKKENSMKDNRLRVILIILSMFVISGCSGTAVNTGVNTTVSNAVIGDDALLESRFTTMDSIFGQEGVPSDNNLILIISDLHMGDQRSIDDGYGWLIQNRAKLVDFLNNLTDRPALKELTIAGDMFDEWVAPMEYDSLNGFGSDQAGESEFFDSIVDANPDIINGFNNIISTGIKVTYVPGNHDMLVVEDDINRAFPGIHQERDATGLGAYSPDSHPEIIIEHSHRYDFYNAPDMYSNRIPISPENYTNNPSAIIPPGFFVSKIDASHSIAYPSIPELEADGLQKLGPFLYWAAWKVVLSQIPVPVDYNAKLIKTGINGYTGVYAINDLVPPTEGLIIKQPLLYQNIEDNWKNRQIQNRVNSPISVLSGLLTSSISEWCDFQAHTQYFSIDSSKRIVVFGHTHKAALGTDFNNSQQKCIDANSGTWIDKGEPACTFVVISTQSQAGAAVNETVSVYQYYDSQNIKILHENTITLN